MNKETIKKARQANLAQYLLSAGIPLVRNGKRYRHKEHNSLIFTENAYFWNSRGEHGNAIDYLVRHMGMSFIEAVSALVPLTDLEPLRPTSTAKVFELNHKALNHNCHKARAYLTQTRNISNNIINHIANENLIFQERRTNNIIFVMRDEHNNDVGAELQGVTATRFKGVMANSKYGYGFNVRFSDCGTYDYALFFESAIDLLSFMDYKQNHENKSLKRCILISMAGLKLNIVKNTLRVFEGARAVVCVDNDSAGRAFCDNLKAERIEYIQRFPDKQFKDWNEQLKAVKQYDKPIQRLFLRGRNGR